MEITPGIMGYNFRRWYYIITHNIIPLWLCCINACDVNMNGLADWLSNPKTALVVILHIGIPRSGNNQATKEGKIMSSWREDKSWIRFDRLNYTKTVVSHKLVRERLNGVYKDLDEAMNGASENEPLSNGMADYWPVAEQSVDRV